MTREDKRIEETNSAAEYFIAGPLCEEKFTEEQEDFVKYCFAEGVKWADENPQSPWISVEEDLPFNHKELLYDTESSILPSTKFVLIRTEKNAYELAYMYNYYGWQWDYELDKVTHWMPIPELPKE